MAKRSYVQAKTNFRKDLNCRYRSGWEANMKRYWNFLDEPAEYEPKEFVFEKIKRGVRFYIPDFYLSKLDWWIEIKGWLNPKDKTKLRRFKKYYPEEFAKLHFIIYDKYSRSKENGDKVGFLLDILKIKFEDIISYKEIDNKFKGIIPNWE